MPTTIGYRRLQALMPYTASLTFNVPPPTEQRNVLDKMAAKQIQRKTKKKEDDGYSSESSSSSSHGSHDQFRPQPGAGLKGRDRKKAEKAEREWKKKEEKRSRRQDKKDAKSHEKSGKRLDKEQKMAGKMEYIVVESLNATSC